MGSLCYAQSMNILASSIKYGDKLNDTNRIVGVVNRPTQRIDGWIRVETDSEVNNVNYFTPFEYVSAIGTGYLPNNS